MQVGAENAGLQLSDEDADEESVNNKTPAKKVEEIEAETESEEENNNNEDEDDEEDAKPETSRLPAPILVQSSVFQVFS